MYDKNNVFAKMVRGEIPTNKVYENDFAMSFYVIPGLTGDLYANIANIIHSPFRKIIIFA